MRFGLLFTGRPAAAGSPADLVTEALRTAHRARDASFDVFAVGQHFVTGPDRYLQPIPLLARLVPETGTMRLATGVLLLPLLEPVHVAEQTATLDVLSGGRLVLGVGQGYREPEFAAFGVRRELRGSRQREALTVIERLWSGEEVDHTGRHFTVSGVRAGMVPVQRPRPEIWCATTIRRRFDDVAAAGYVPYLGPTMRRSDLRDWLADGVPAGGVAMRRDVFVTAPGDEGAANRHVAEQLRQYGDWGFTDASPSGDAVAERYLVGSPRHCVDQLHAYAALGVDTVVLRCQWPSLGRDETLRMVDLAGEVVRTYREELS